MRIPSKAAFAAGILLIPVFVLCNVGKPSAQTCPGGTTNVCPTVESVNTLETVANPSPPPFVYTSGYRNDGDAGGGILYEKRTGSCSTNGGTKLNDLAGHCYLAETFPQNFLQWGGYCDATNPAYPVLLIVGNATFEGPGKNLNLSVGLPIVITGAASSGATLATTIDSVGTPTNALGRSGTTTAGSNIVSVTTTNIVAGMSVTDESGNTIIPAGTIVLGVTGSSSITISQAALGGSATLDFYGTPVTLHDAPSTATPIYVATDVPTVMSSGTHSYNLGDVPTLTDGTQVQVVGVDGSGNIKQAQVLVQAHDAHAWGPMTDTYGSTFTLKFSPSGQFWYGHDDSVQLQAAINASESAPGTDIFLPANLACGVKSTITLPGGANSLRGYGSNSSGIVALASMPLDTHGFSYVLERPTNPIGATGGGARELYVEGNMLATDTCGVQGGQNQVYEDTTCSDGTSAEWLCGGDTASAQMTNNLFLHIEGQHNYNMFSFTGQQSQSNWDAEAQCTWASIIASKFHSGLTGILDGQSDWNVYTDDNVTGSAPFNAQDCAHFLGRQQVTNLECDNPSRSAVHVSGNTVVVEGVSTNWDHSLPGAACTVLIDAAMDYDYISGVQSHPLNANGVAPDNVICPIGTLGPNIIITGNPNSALQAGVYASGFARIIGGTSDSMLITDDTVLWNAPGGGGVGPRPFLFVGQAIRRSFRRGSAPTRNSLSPMRAATSARTASLSCRFPAP